jgi:hypothetical protein
MKKNIGKEFFLKIKLSRQMSKKFIWILLFMFLVYLLADFSFQILDAKDKWILSPYPEGFDFAFTIVHDADNAYSKRLRPLYDVFDALGIKTSITVFAFGHLSEKETSLKGDFWSRKGVPLSDSVELEFYKSLTKNGHEIGLHTASDLSDTRDVMIKAFEYFNQKFGYYPPLYVEHRSEDNLECIQREGNNPESNYYVIDILNKYQPWVWCITPSAIPYEGRGEYFNLLKDTPKYFNSDLVKLYYTAKNFIKTGRWNLQFGENHLLIFENNTPFDHYVTARYGLNKTFRRTGRSENAHGAGFLKWYTKKNIDQLAKDRGLAIVYTHLNSGWLDPETKKMSTDIEDVLTYISEKDVWLAPATKILDRFRALEYINLVYSHEWLKIINTSNSKFTGITLISNSKKHLYADGEIVKKNENKEVLIGEINPRETLIYEIR